MQIRRGITGDLFYCKPSLLECLSETTLLGFEPVQSPTKVEAVLEFVNCMKDTLSEAQAALAKSKDDMAHYYNHCHMPCPNIHSW